MSVVIIGGNECMVRQYKDLCQEYQCDAKVFPKQKSSLKGIGCPDLMVLLLDSELRETQTTNYFSVL